MRPGRRRPLDACTVRVDSAADVAIGAEEKLMVKECGDIGGRMEWFQRVRYSCSGGVRTREVDVQFPCAVQFHPSGEIQHAAGRVVGLGALGRRMSETGVKNYYRVLVDQEHGRWSWNLVQGLKKVQKFGGADLPAEALHAHRHWCVGTSEAIPSPEEESVPSSNVGHTRGKKRAVLHIEKVDDARDEEPQLSGTQGKSQRTARGHKKPPKVPDADIPPHAPPQPESLPAAPLHEVLTQILQHTEGIPDILKCVHALQQNQEQNRNLKAEVARL